MIIKHNDKQYEKLVKKSERDSEIDHLMRNALMYLQIAEVSENGLVLSRQPWKFSKIHKLTGNKNNVYAFGISKSKRTISYGNDEKALCLSELTELEIIEYICDYH